jgi:HYDIN/CFA65/VesB family protein
MRQGLRLLIVTVFLAVCVPGCSDVGKPLFPVPKAVLSTHSIDFGTVAVSDSALRSVTLRNEGRAALEGVPVLSCVEYFLVSGGPFRIPPGGSVTIVLGFRPGAVGSFPCELDLGADVPKITLAGSGALQALGALCVLVPDSLDFGTIAKDQSATQSFQVFSVGTAPLLVNVVAGCGDFSIATGGGPATLAPGHSITVTVRFAPQAGLTRNCSVSVGPGCPEEALTGFGTTVSFANDVQPIFRNWGCDGCHGLGDPDIGYSIVTTWPISYPPGVRVIPYDLDRSVLYGKITNSGQYGGMMPPTGSLIPLADRETIKNWILEGARDN